MLFFLLNFKMYRVTEDTVHHTMKNIEWTLFFVFGHDLVLSLFVLVPDLESTSPFVLRNVRTCLGLSISGLDYSPDITTHEILSRPFRQEYIRDGDRSSNIKRECCHHITVNGIICIGRVRLDFQFS